jgi:hypothetical protein
VEMTRRDALTKAQGLFGKRATVRKECQVVDRRTGRIVCPPRVQIGVNDNQMTNLVFRVKCQGTTFEEAFAAYEKSIAIVA